MKGMLADRFSVLSAGKVSHIFHNHNIKLREKIRTKSKKKTGPMIVGMGRQKLIALAILYC